MIVMCGSILQERASELECLTHLYIHVHDSDVCANKREWVIVRFHHSLFC